MSKDILADALVLRFCVGNKTSGILLLVWSCEGPSRVGVWSDVSPRQLGRRRRETRQEREYNSKSVHLSVLLHILSFLSG